MTDSTALVIATELATACLGATPHYDNGDLADFLLGNAFVRCGFCHTSAMAYSPGLLFVQVRTVDSETDYHMEGIKFFNVNSPDSIQRMIDHIKVMDRLHQIAGRREYDLLAKEATAYGIKFRIRER